jgi:hypothetical protein
MGQQPCEEELKPPLACPVGMRMSAYHGNGQRVRSRRPSVDLAGTHAGGIMAVTASVRYKTCTGNLRLLEKKRFISSLENILSSGTRAVAVACVNTF